MIDRMSMVGQETMWISSPRLNTDFTIDLPAIEADGTLGLGGNQSWLIITVIF